MLSGLISTRAPRAARKAAAQLWVRRNFGAELGEDEADAAVMATWALRLHAMRRAA
jgi:hypothetical protein